MPTSISANGERDLSLANCSICERIVFIVLSVCRDSIKLLSPKPTETNASESAGTAPINDAFAGRGFYI